MRLEQYRWFRLLYELSGREGVSVSRPLFYIKDLRVLRALLITFALALFVCSGCKESGSGEPGDESKSQQRGQDGPNGGDGEMPWPPPGGKKSDIPPGVQQVMSKMMNAFNSKNASQVEQFFITRDAFVHVSDCDPADVVDRVMDGRRQAGERASRDGGDARFDGWKDGYIFELKKGDKPAECRAREDVGLFMARFDWTIKGKKEAGEAHFVRINGIWYFAKF